VGRAAATAFLVRGRRWRRGHKRRACPRAMPPRRRRDGAAVPARTSGQPPGRVRVPLRQKAPRSRSAVAFREAASVSRILAGATTGGPPDLTHIASGDPGARNATRRARAISFAKRASPSLERSGPRLARVRPCTSPLAGPRYGNASKGQRMLASVGASEQRSESSARARGLKARQGVPVRRIRFAEDGRRRRG